MEIQVAKKTHVTWHYYVFLLLSLAKSVTCWIIAALYFIFTWLFLYVVPTVSSETVLSIWSSSTIGPQLFLMYVGVLLISVVAIFVFRNYQDDGTELIICSKPISRLNLCISKFLVVLTYVVCLSLVISIVPIIILLTNLINTIQFWGLIASMFLWNFVYLLVFGMIAIFVSLFANKVWICIVNIVILFLFNIFSVVNSTAIYSPKQVILNDNQHAITSKTIGLYNEEKDDFIQKTTASISSLTVDPNKAMQGGMVVSMPNNPYEALKGKPGAFANIDPSVVFGYDDEVEVWENAKKESKSTISNIFDLTKQYNKIANSFSLENEYEKVSGMSFGKDSFLNYDPTGLFLLEDEEEGYEPLVYIKVSNDGQSTFEKTNDENEGDVVDDENSDDPTATINWSDSFSYYLFTSIFSQSTVFLGEQQNDINSLMSNFISKDIDTRVLNVGEAYYVSNDHKTHYTKLHANDLKSNDSEKTVFNTILNTFYNALKSEEEDENYDGDLLCGHQSSFDWNDKKYVKLTSDALGNYAGLNIDKSLSYDPADFTNMNEDDLTLNPWYWNFSRGKTGVPIVHNWWDYVHYMLTTEKTTLNIENLNDLLNETLKFKFWLWKNLIVDTPKFDSAKDTTLKGIFDDTLGNDFFMPLTHETLTDPFPSKFTDSPDMYSKGSLLFPKGAGQEGYVEDYASLFLPDLYLSVSPFVEEEDLETVDVNPYFGWKTTNGLNLYAARSLIENYVINDDNFGYLSLDSTANAGVNPAARDNLYVGSILTSSSNLFVNYERGDFVYDISPKLNSYFYTVIWMTVGIFLAGIVFIIYYRKDFK